MPPEFWGLARLLSAASASVEGLQDRALVDLDISTAQYSVLSMFASRAWTCTQLSSVLLHDAGALSRMLWRLESKRMLRRLPVPGDRRVAMLELTEHGAAVLDAGHSASFDAVSKCFGDLSGTELNLLASVLRKLSIEGRCAPAALERRTALTVA